MDAKYVRLADKDYEKEFEEYLENMFGSVDVAGFKYDTSYVLREISPGGYRDMYVDFVDEHVQDLPEQWACGECGDEHDSEEEANECCSEEG